MKKILFIFGMIFFTLIPIAGNITITIPQALTINGLSCMGALEKLLVHAEPHETPLPQKTPLEERKEEFPWLPLLWKSGGIPFFLGYIARLSWGSVFFAILHRVITVMFQGIKRYCPL